jgi:hypothetical protein
VELTDNMVRAIAKQAEAERDRRAKIIHADAEFQASQTLVNAATILGSVPAAMQLRYLNPGGLLPLGNSETIAADDDGFTRVSKSARLYRHETGARARPISLWLPVGEGALSLARAASASPISTSNARAEHFRASMLAHYAPSAMLINAKAESRHPSNVKSRDRTTPGSGAGFCPISPAT